MPRRPAGFRSYVGRTRRGALAASVALALVGSLALAGCDGKPEATQNPSPSANGKADGLDDMFTDSDGDLIPDGIQKAMGEDGTTDTCASKVCKSQADAKNGALAKIVRGTSTMIILDSSGSMISKTRDGSTRIDAAKKAIKDYVANSPKSTERLGLMVYGQAGSNKKKDKALSCSKIDTLQSIGNLNSGNVSDTLGEFEPTGWTPLAGSLRAASKQFDNEKNRVNRIIVVTDGKEECGGHPQSEARKLRRSGFNVRIDVVGLGVDKDSPAGGQMHGVADAGGGKFTTVQDSAGMQSYFNQLLGQWVATANLSDCVSKHSTDYSTCQAARWQKASVKLNSEITKLRKQGKTVPASQLQTQTNDSAQYFLTTLTTRGLSAAQEFTPDSAEVKKIKKHLEATPDGRAVIRVNTHACR